jgi:hypothetical protein
VTSAGLGSSIAVNSDQDACGARLMMIDADTVEMYLSNKV